MAGCTGGGDGCGGGGSGAKDNAAGGGEWVTVLKPHRLMRWCHREDDAQMWHVISTREFESAFDRRSRVIVRRAPARTLPWRPPGSISVSCAGQSLLRRARTPASRPPPRSRAIHTWHLHRLHSRNDARSNDRASVQPLQRGARARLWGERA